MKTISAQEYFTSSIFIIEYENNYAVSVMEYFYDTEKQANDDSSEDLIYKCYEAVLDSKSKDETLVS